jgi:Uma2 family endonuclease
MLSYRSMVDLASLSPERIRPIRRVEYDRMVDMGLFEDERVELLAGVLVEMSPQGTRHAEAVSRLMRHFMGLELQGRARIRLQLPFALDELSEPEPDLVVVPAADCSHEHPRSALLMIEVSESSVRKDRHIKGALYGAQGVREYWVVNLVDDVIEIRRDPGADGYATLATYSRGDAVAPADFPDLVLAVDDLLPT